MFTQLTDDEKYILLRRCYKRESDPNKKNRIVTRKDVKTQEPYVKAVANAITRFNSDLASLREKFNFVAGAPGDFTSKANTSLLVKLVDGSYDHQFDLAGSASSTRISAISSVYERIRRQFEQAQAKSSELAKEKEPPASKNSTKKTKPLVEVKMKMMDLVVKVMTPLLEVKVKKEKAMEMTINPRLTKRQLGR